MTIRRIDYPNGMACRGAQQLSISRRASAGLITLQTIAGNGEIVAPAFTIPDNRDVVVKLCTALLEAHVEVHAHLEEGK